MNLRKLLTGLLLAVFTLAVSAAEPEAKKPATEKPEAKKPEGKKPEAGGKAKAHGQSERTCALTITWWEDPALAEGEHLELGVQGDTGVTPIAPSAMSPSGTILYEGPAAVAVVRKGTMPDPSGKAGAKPIETWFPFATFNLGPDDREVLAILFSVDGTRKVMTRSFNINAENFPFGGFHVYNFSKTKLLCSMGGKVFFAEPGKRTPSPVVMTQREVVNFFLGITDADGAQKLIFRAPLILTEKIRRLYFVVENPEGEGENRFTTHTMLQHVAGHRTIESMKGMDTPADGEEKPSKAAPKTPSKKSEGSGEGTAKPKAP